LFPFHYHINKTSYNWLEQNIAGQISNKTFKTSSGACLYDDERDLLQPNEANYIHLNAGSRTRSPCIPPVNTCHMVVRSKACGTIAMGSGAFSSEQI